MRFLFIFCSLIVPISSYCQSHFSMSSFQEGRALYVTAIPSLTSTKSYSGNGFAVKIDSELFLITNRHIFETNDYYTNISHSDSTFNYIKYLSLQNVKWEINTRQIRSSKGELFYGNNYES